MPNKEIFHGNQEFPSKFLRIKHTLFPFLGENNARHPTQNILEKRNIYTYTMTMAITANSGACDILLKEDLSIYTI